MQISLGAMAPTLSEQFGPLLPKKEARRLQGIADAITMLAIHGYLSDNRKEIARQKLMREIKDAIQHEEKP